MLTLIVVCTFFSVFLFSKLIFYKIISRKLSISNRLENMSVSKTIDNNEEFNQPLFDRIVKPILDDMSKIIIRIAPKEIIKKLEKKIIMAGNPMNLSVKDWMNFFAIVFTLPIIIFIIGFNMGMEIGQLIYFCIGEISIGIIFPMLILNSNIAKRKKLIVNSLPDMLDLLTVSVEAGLGFDAALIRVTEKIEGPLSSEFSRLIQEVKVGRPKKEALKDLSERVGIQDLSVFISSIIQAEQLGVSIGNVLRIQSEQLRQKRRQRAQEKAMKAPVKIIIPMVLFIFPTIFTVIIGPVVIRMIHNFAK